MNSKIKQEVIRLLPWYNLGKLTDEEKTLVEEALLKEPSLQDDLLLEKQIMEQVQKDKTLMDGSIFSSLDNRLDNVMMKLEQPVVAAKPKKRSKATKTPGIISQITNHFNSLLSGNSHTFTYAVFAALTVVQLALLVLFIVPSDNMDTEKSSTYNLASYNEQSDQLAPTTESNSGQMILLIGMDNNFKAEGFSEILGSDVHVDILPDSSGYYRVRLSKHLSTREIEDLKNELSKKHGKIWFIGEESPQ